MSPRERIASARLYLVCDARPRDFLRRALAGGVDVIQLRDRSLDDDGVLREAARFAALAAEAGARFVLNDRPDLALACGADGVHLGQDDMGPAEARAIVGPDAIIGRSTHGPAQGEAAAQDPDVSYLSIGPVWPTPTKPGRPAAGIEYVQWAATHVGKPWFAIGGVDETTVTEVVAAGATRVVVVRAILEADNPEGAAARLRAAVAGRSASDSGAGAVRRA
jgi:thiamine-phosphate pyrophosphorylase